MLPLCPARPMLVQAVRIAMKLEVVPDAVVVVWDMDKQGDARRNGLVQGRNAASALFGERGIVLGCPDPNREAWVLVGFDAEDDNERRRFADERSALGF